MNKLFLIAALACVAYAQDAKFKGSPTRLEDAGKPTERTLTETEALKLQLIAAKLQLLQERYKIAEFQKDAQPLNAEQETVATAACQSLGIPAEKIRTECGIQTGLGQDGKPLTGPDGKPVVAKVWWVKPAAPPVATEKKN